jgi:hypothetical protein
LAVIKLKIINNITQISLWCQENQFSNMVTL